MRRPSALQLVAWLFIGYSIWAAVSIAGALLIERRIDLNMEVLGLWIGPGLLRHEARFRTWAIRLLILGFCLAPIAGLLLIFHTRPLEVRLLGRPVGTVSLPIGLSVLAVIVAVSIWQYWVLSQARVRALFSAPAVEHPGASV
jgi:hypothetical protein